MEERERSRSRSPRRVRRVEQVVGRWLRRSRDSLSRERILGDRKSGRSEDGGQQHFPVKETVEVIRDAVLDSHGFTLSTQLPLLVRDVIPGGPADGRLLPGDQLLKVNNKAIDDLSPEFVENMIRECQDSVTMTILRNMLNPKSSFMTAEKRARLRRNPVKVHFAEEVVVNGHAQGNSLLFLPNVLKVYLENGQTKAFKFDKTTTVKDIELTLKEKLSIQCIEYFSLVLEQQYSITKLLLLHEDELIQKVVQKKDSHDYRCLFRVCFIPRDPVDLLHDDPVAFEYLFHQSVGDVLQERFAVEMKCNTALRLAALHMHERMASSGHTTRASVKSIIKEFGLESFISPTLLRNMKEKDLRKALTSHMKKIQSLLEPRQKVFSVPQARLAYLTQMAELISYSGRSYNATMLLQDRESLVSLLVGARYGVSQILNHKLNMISTIIDFHYISRVEVLSESDRVSMIKIYLHDIQPLALLMDSVSAKDLACLLAGYCKLLVDPNMNVFRWGPRPKIRRIPLDEGYGFRCGSGSEASSEEDYPMDNVQDAQFSKDTAATNAREDGKDEEDKQGVKAETVRVIVTQAEVIVNAEGDCFEGTSTSGFIEDEDYATRVDALLETGWYTDPRVNSSFSSLSSNSLNALEESSSRVYITGPFLEEISKSDQATGSSLDVHHPYLLEVPEQLNQDDDSNMLAQPGLRYSDYSQMSNYLPSPTEASDDALSDLEGDENRNYRVIPGVSADLDTVPASGSSSSIKSTVAGVDVQALLARIRNHPACKQEWENSNLSQREHAKKSARVKAPPPPPRIVSSRVYEITKDSRDNCSESEDEFFDAQDRLTPPVLDPIGEKDLRLSCKKQSLKMTGGKVSVEKTSAPETIQNHEDKQHRNASLPASRYSLKKKTSSITLAEAHQPSLVLLNQQTLKESKPVLGISEQKGQRSNGEIHGRNAHLLEMEPDTMEFKPVTTTGPLLPSPLITAVWQGNSQPVPTVNPEALWNEGKQQQETSSHAPIFLANAIPSHAPVKTSDYQNISKPTEIPEDERAALIKNKKAAESQTLSISQPKKDVSSKPPVPPKPTSIVFQPSSVPNINPPLKPEGKKHVPLNGLALPPWSQEKRTNPAPTLSKGVSLSHENLRSELNTEDTTVKVTSASTTPTPTSTPTPSPSAAIRGSISMDHKDPFGIGVSLSSRTSSGRLSASALRGKIQDMPWYLTRSQEILGTVALSGNRSSDTKASKDTDEHKEPIKESQKVTSIPSLNEWKDKDAEVVVVKLKDGPQQVASLVKETSETSLSLSLDLNQNALRGSNELYSHLGTCKSEQPQSQKDCGTKDGLERPSPPSSTGTPHRKACGCHTVYAHCFSGDLEDTCSFDDDLTVYEFSRQKRISKPPQTFSTPSSLTAPSPNILSLLRDSPRPLSNSSELSPLLTPPRPLEPRLLGCSRLEDPLRDLQSRRYIMGPKGTGLKGGYTSLHRDIDELLLVLKNGECAIKPACHKEQCDKGSCMNGHSISDSERCLVQAEARRLASGCQRATRVSWAPDDALLSLGNSFGALVHLAAACLRVSCSECRGCHVDIDGAEALRKLQEIVCLYKEFVTAVEMTQEGEGVRLLAKQCTVLISTVFSLTQLFRTHTPDTDNRHLPLNF
ncbi:FERM and PDZ domain-containing protein 1 isoform X1 [Electrophorus electricus]|uniref:FERM and PDZ domain-containing protein 1 isoform X1 n=1 Tax=Electrophorus electricus TaxID=8005 RepID=UPI0015D0267F|nr:FERM and PDZ domain-containing protein 1 isoform X1 [Electrophorus electricus]XP_026873208.2 FERM and PDZ domain-containing protein 1 isoform X1 [Electrophorus electricus]XP_026873216.2 FERM and PDZ domain-containing protein 1 isoform X1 [Electrophorus electricus]